MPKPYMNFFLALNQSYLVGATVTMTSILKNTNPAYKVRFFLITEGFTKEDIEKIETIKNIAPCDIIHISAKDYTYLFENIDTTKFYSEYFSIAIYYSLLIFKVLPEDVDKCFYIDCDMIVNVDLSLVYEAMPKDKLAVAVVEFTRSNDPHGKVFQYKQEIFPKFWENPHQYPYFNAGFFLLNMDRVRMLGIDKEIFDTLEKYPSLPFLDQDILNLVLGQNHTEQMVYIPPKYNILCFEHYKNIKYYNPFYKKEDIMHAIHYPLVLHFGGKKKPWLTRSKDINHYDLWWYYCRMSPFYDLLEPPISKGKIESVYLLNKLMVLRIKIQGNVAVYYLLGLLPILGKRGNENRAIYYLFGLVPILKKKVNEDKVRYHLFGFFPLIKIKSRERNDA